MTTLKQLPEYFVIKRESENPLWSKYIDWVNHQSGNYFEGDHETYCFYGILEPGWSNYNSNFDCPILTLEEWDSIVNPKEETTHQYVENGINGTIYSATIQKQPKLKVGDKIPEYLSENIKTVSGETYRILGFKCHFVDAIEDGTYKVSENRSPIFNSYVLKISEVDALIEEHERRNEEFVIEVNKGLAAKNAGKYKLNSGNKNSEPWQPKNGDEVYCNIGEWGNCIFIAIDYEKGWMVVRDKFGQYLKASEIKPKKVTVTHKEIAEWKGCDVEQLIIEK